MSPSVLFLSFVRTGAAKSSVRIRHTQADVGRL
jgi:hypothetical protein